MLIMPLKPVVGRKTLYNCPLQKENGYTAHRGLLL